jgi:hypothetical protein
MDESDRPADDEPRGADDPDTLGDGVTRVVESAAELGLGAVIGPFTGGETVNIVGSVASMLEAGVDRLTHLGEHESVPDDPDDPDYPSGPAPSDSPGDDGRE